MAGVPTTGGSRLYDDRLPAADAVVVQPAARRRHDHRRQDPHAGAGLRRLGHQCRVRHAAQPLRSPRPPGARRFLQRLGRRGGGASRAHGARHGHGRLGAHSRGRSAAWWASRPRSARSRGRASCPCRAASTRVGPMTTSVADAELLYTVLAGPEAGLAGKARRRPAPHRPAAGGGAGRLRPGRAGRRWTGRCACSATGARRSARSRWALPSSTLVEKNGIAHRREGWQEHGSAHRRAPGAHGPGGAEALPARAGRSAAAGLRGRAAWTSWTAQERVPGVAGRPRCAAHADRAHARDSRRGRAGGRAAAQSLHAGRELPGPLRPHGARRDSTRPACRSACS